MLSSCCKSSISFFTPRVALSVALRTQTLPRLRLKLYPWHRPTKRRASTPGLPSLKFTTIRPSSVYTSNSSQSNSGASILYSDSNSSIRCLILRISALFFAVGKKQTTFPPSPQTSTALPGRRRSNPRPLNASTSFFLLAAFALSSFLVSSPAPEAFP